MESRSSVCNRHKRSKSDCEKAKEDIPHSSDESLQNLKLEMGKVKGLKEKGREPCPVTMAKTSLKKEILQLERHLKDQIQVRGVLEKALGHNSSTTFSSNESSMPKPAKDLIKEIATLELEVVHLEQYLLSLYRKAFDQQIPTLTPTSPHDNPKRMLFRDESTPNLSSSRSKSIENSTYTLTYEKKDIKVKQVVDMNTEKLTGPGAHRCQSDLSHRAVYLPRTSPSADSLSRALQACHSLPLHYNEEVHCGTSGIVSLAEYLGTNISDHIPETPNRISEDMVRCMSTIFCKLADPPLVQTCLPSSPTSSFSSTSALSPQYIGDVWSPNCKRDSTLDVRLINPFRVEGIKEFSGPYNAMVEIILICTDRQKLQEVDDLMENYKTLIRRLETVDPRKMTNEEKLAFWINIHNAILMHAYLSRGILQKQTKKESLLIQPSCVIGGRSISAYTIQRYILGSRTSCHGQWFRSILSPRMRLKAGGEWRAFAIERPEPLLHFSLCSGSHSDPAVRVYSYKRVYQQLELAKEEYIRATVGIKNEEKIFLPKIVETYSKDVNLTSQGTLGMIKKYLPEKLRMAMKRCQQGRSHRTIEWVPYNFSFRYLLSRELANI